MLRDLAVPLAAVSACVVLFRLGIVGLIERLFPLDETTLTVVRRVGVTAALLGGYWLVGRFYERRSLGELAFRPLAIAFGALGGALLVGTAIVMLRGFGYYHVVAHRGWSAVVPIATMILLIVLFEEVVFRGVVFRIFEQYAGTLTALVIQSAVFGVLHLANEGATAMTPLSVSLLGALWTAIYVVWRNLWVVIAHHAAWNLTIFASGLPLSGAEDWRPLAPREVRIDGPELLTGGAFGPEDSLVTIVLIAVTLVALLRLARRRRRFVIGPWRDRTRDGVTEPPLHGSAP